MAQWKAVQTKTVMVMGRGYSKRNELITGGGRLLGCGRQLPPQLTVDRRPRGGLGRGGFWKG